jgi:hypothetical protein
LEKVLVYAAVSVGEKNIMTWHLEHARFGNQPWKVQEAYLKRASGKARFGNFSQQGLGKTAATLNEYVTLVEDGEVDLCIVLAPSSFIGDWPLAVPEWGLEMNADKWNGKNNWPTNWETGLFAIAHETLRGSERARVGLIQLLKARPCFLVFDESSSIKKHNSLLAEYMIGEVCKYVKHLRILNGTPIVQNAMDYYAQLRCLGEFNGMNPYAFRNRFCVMGGFMGKQVKGIKNEDELARVLDRCSFRALKKDWRKDLPDQIEVPVHLEMTKNQLLHYRTMVEEFYAVIGDGEIFAELTLTQRLKLAQISSCLMMDDGKTHWIEEPYANPKVRAIHDLFEIDQTKTIIVYIFDASGRMLIKEMTEKKLNPAWITGGMKSEELIAQKDKFNNDPTCRVLIGQEDQSSRGHTLIGQKGDRCSRMVYYENSLSLMHRLQMNDRNHRGEQDETCLIYDLIPSPIDQINVDILQGKRSQADGMDALVAEIRKTVRTPRAQENTL